MKLTSSIVMMALWAAPGLLADQDQPGRGVARVSLINGDITTQRGDSGDSIAASVNAPLVTGDKIHAGPASRAEVQFDHANFLRIGEKTEIRLADLERGRYQLQVSRGLLTYRILREPTAEVEINTPVVAVRPRKRGIYRVMVREDGETEITVRDGEAEVSSRQGTEILQEGRTMIARTGSADPSIEAQVLSEASRDDWDRWNERRDKQLSRSRSYDYVHRSVYGAQDLDDYGNWHSVGGYGWCWFPRVSLGWAPYSYGRWSWIDWYGWSWIGYEPWGWAPYHYGRWFHNRHYGWGWYPGSLYRTSYWSPALVGFFGWGSRSGFDIGLGFGYSHLGWVPLAPGEHYYPWYGHGYYGRGSRNVYIDNSVNITNITNIRNVYRNAGAKGGVISVHAEEFSRGRAAGIRRVDVGEIRNAGQIRGLIPVVPERESLRVSDREVRAAALPRAEATPTRFFTRREPASLERVPFAEQQQQIARSIRGDRDSAGPRVAGTGEGATASPAVGQQPRSIRSLGDNTATQPGAQPNPSTSSGRGWRRFGEERRAGPEAPVTPQSTERTVDRNTTWRRFGEERNSRPDPGSSPRVRDQSAGGDSPWRRFGQLDRDNRPEPPRGESSEQRRSIQGLGRWSDESRPNRERSISPQQESPRFERRSEPPQPRGDGGGERRQLQINRPIMMDRAPRHEGGQSSPRSGGASSDGGGRQVERGGGRSSRR